MRNIVLRLTICLFALLSATSLYAHHKSDSDNTPQANEKYQKMLIEYQLKDAKEKVEMNDEQYAKFEPLYREYLEIVNPQPRYRKPKESGGAKANKPSEEEFDKMMMQDFERQKEVAETRLEYYPKFREIFSARDVMTIYRSEARSIREIRDKLNSRSKGGEKK